MTTTLSLDNVTRRYGTAERPIVALDGVDFYADAGELVGIMGPSGSGKSTLLTILGALDIADSGSVEVSGRSIVSLDPTALAEVRRTEIGFVFQDLNLLDGLNAAENIAAPLELGGVSTRIARAEAEQRLAQVGLADRADAFPTDLSGGERQRVAIARALVGDRRILLADEPTGALDSVTGGEVMDLLRAVCDAGGTVVVVTHDPDVAARADRVVLLRDGRVEGSYVPGRST